MQPPAQAEPDPAADVARRVAEQKRRLDDELERANAQSLLRYREEGNTTVFVPEPSAPAAPAQTPDERPSIS